jgi:selenocysteine lyase/cysteine desulfurase
VHYAPHALVDVREIADFVLCSAYKFYGPHIGVCFGRHAALDLPRLNPRRTCGMPQTHAESRGHQGAAAAHFIASLAPCGRPIVARDSPRVQSA